MDKPRLKNKHGKEFGIQAEVVKFLKTRGWHVERLVGGAFQSGLPDLFACHLKFGFRFIEIKYEDSYHFTKAQKWKFPLLVANGCGIWILTEASEEQYDRLFKEPNLWDYLKRKDCLNVKELDNILEEMEE
jgi:hypothetical protein